MIDVNIVFIYFKQMHTFSLTLEYRVCECFDLRCSNNIQPVKYILLGVSLPMAINQITTIFKLSTDIVELFSI